MLLRQSTSIDLPVGPFVDNQDGYTPETALTLTQPDVRLKKVSAAWGQKAAAQTLTHEENGWYEVTLDATDTDTLGSLELAIYESGALPVWREFQVVPAAVWDALFAGTGAGIRAATQSLAADSITAASIAADAITAAKIANGAIDAATFAANAINAAALDPDVTTELQGGLATAAALAVVDAIVDDILVDTAVIGALGAGLTALATQVSVNDLPTNAELATALGTADDAVLAILGTPAGVSLAADIAAIEAQTDDIGAAGAGLTALATAAALATAQTAIDDIPTTAELATSQAAADDATLTAIAALNNLSAAQAQTAAQAALDATIADAIPADGTRPSVSSGIYMLTQASNDRGIVGTTMTVYKPDGVTALFTVTLDDATNPTRITRA